MLVLVLAPFDIATDNIAVVLVEVGRCSENLSDVIAVLALDGLLSRPALGVRVKCAFLALDGCASGVRLHRLLCTTGERSLDALQGLFLLFTEVLVVRHGVHMVSRVEVVRLCTDLERTILLVAL